MFFFSLIVIKKVASKAITINKHVPNNYSYSPAQATHTVFIERKIIIIKANNNNYFFIV